LERRRGDEEEEVEVEVEVGRASVCELLWEEYKVLLHHTLHTHHCNCKHTYCTHVHRQEWTQVLVNTHTVHMYTDRSGLCPPLLFSASSSPHLLQPLDALKDVAAHGEDLKVGHAAEGDQSVDGIC
jgi:hypothetical protein